MVALLRPDRALGAPDPPRELFKDQCVRVLITVLYLSDSSMELQAYWNHRDPFAYLWVSTQQFHLLSYSAGAHIRTSPYYFLPTTHSFVISSHSRVFNFLPSINGICEYILEYPAWTGWRWSSDGIFLPAVSHTYSYMSPSEFSIHIAKQKPHQFNRGYRSYLRFHLGQHQYVHC